MNNAEPPNVVILIDTGTSWGRRVIRGVTRYAQSHGPWHLVVAVSGDQGGIHIPPGWNGDGIIARISSATIQGELTDVGVPTVNVSAIQLPHRRFPRVNIDYDKTADHAAQHFLERGYEHFGYVGPLSVPVVERHAEAFIAALEGRSKRIETFNYPQTTSTSWTELHDALGDWLEALPKPAGVFGWATEPGTRVLDMCRYRGIAVPSEIAVLADDDDPLLCSMTIPPMSAVLHAAEQVGYHAARQLAEFMRDPEAWSRMSAEDNVEMIAPVQVTARGSTDSYAIQDPEVIRAIAYIRQNAYGPLHISDVADAVPIGRRTLERKFRQSFGRTPHEEIKRLRISRVKDLLATTDLPISMIAVKSGFCTPEHMTNNFRQVVGLSPLRYRKKLRGD